MGRRFDIVVYGPTGFTGKLTSHYLQRNAAKSVKWALAGRSLNKLEAIREEIGAPKSVETMVAAADNAKELDAVCQSTKVVIACVGPFSLHGRAMLSACVRNKTHYVDITGEFPYVRWAIETYHEEAEKNGTLIVPCCGFDSVPSDITNYLLHEEARAAKTTMSSVVSYQKLLGGTISGGTFHTALHIFGSMEKKDNNPYSLVPSTAPTPRVYDYLLPGYSVSQGKFVAPAPMAGINTKVARRTNALSADTMQNNCTYAECMAGGFIASVLATVGMYIVLILMSLPPARKLLAKYGPAQGTGGDVTKSNGFKVRTVGYKGFNEPVLAVEMVAPEDAYLFTARSVAECALAIVSQYDSLPRKGGVLTPGAAFGSVLVQRLRNTGITIGLAAQ